MPLSARPIFLTKPIVQKWFRVAFNLCKSPLKKSFILKIYTLFHKEINIEQLKHVTFVLLHFNGKDTQLALTIIWQQPSAWLFIVRLQGGELDLLMSFVQSIKNEQVGLLYFLVQNRRLQSCLKARVHSTFWSATLKLYTWAYLAWCQDLHTKDKKYIHKDKDW